MNLRRKAPQDSLYLLLDTLCNAFGAIILLAVLVVLLTSKEKSQTAKASESSAAAQRQLAAAQASLQASAQLAVELQAKAGDERWKQQISLLAARKDLQDQLQQLQDTIAQDAAELETAGAADPSARLKFLNSQMASAQARQAAATNQLAATEQASQHLKQRLADLKKQVAAKQADSERLLRLPKEHDPGKRVMYIIVRYGRLYPCHYADMSENDNDIKWTKLGVEERAEPIPDRGYDAAGIAAYFGQLSGNEIYLVFCVFEDSFPPFIRAKALALSEGISCGWEPFGHGEGPVTFSPFGSAPGAQ